MHAILCILRHVEHANFKLNVPILCTDRMDDAGCITVLLPVLEGAHVPSR